MEKTEFEHCVLCGKEISVEKDLPLSLRKNYIEGCGQLCDTCAEEINSALEKMKNQC